MRIAYDPEVDALSITFRETSAMTRHLAEGIAGDSGSKDGLGPSAGEALPL